MDQRPTEITHKRVEILMATSTARMEVFKTTVTSRSGDYEMQVNLTKVTKGELLSIENPMKTYPYLKDVQMDDKNAKPLLPVHAILGARLYARIQTDT